MSGERRTQVVVLVHGLWFGAWSLGLLARRLRKAGFRPLRFRYRTTRAGLDDHAAELQRFVGRVGETPVHFVAHSLGGLVTLRMLAGRPNLPGGRVVLLGSPLNGSAVARRAARIPGGARLLGQVRPTLERGFGTGVAERETGMIAGSRSFGLGLVVGGAGGAGDGTVAVSETRADGLRDHLVLPVTHTGMLFSAAVARQAARFLQSGSFSRSP
jgi:pimeloyl-ACP methyl ester carboxylesterase